MFAKSKPLVLGIIVMMVSLYPIGLFAEICDNGIDDDGDELIDLNDPDCACLEAEPVSLIPNPSFEEITCCPFGNAQLDCAQTWIQASEATTDYYNRCGYFERSQFPVPRPIPDGNAYIGFRNGRFSNDDPNPNWKEYTGACLNGTLEAGELYKFQFYIGFVSQEVSPPMTLVLYGTTDCKNLPFGVGDRRFGCPLNGPGWQVLGQVNISGNRNWKQYEISTVPREDIVAIAIGPDCIELDLEVNPYYFIDNLILADAQLFGPTTVEVGHPCNAMYTLIASNRADASYQWYRNGIALVGETRRELTLNNLEGTYQVRLKNSFGCILSEPIEYTRPVIDVEKRKVICPDASYTFGSRTLDKSGIYTEQFISKDGCDSIVELELIILTEHVDTVEAHFFKGETFKMGPYKFTNETNTNLTLESSIGCDSLVHLILKEYDLYVPNAFSPNDDGINDYFSVYGDENLLKVESVKIYDRWGNQIFTKQNDTNFQWDGMFNGQYIPAGVYIYTLDLKLNDGNRKIIKGDITLLR